MTGSTLHYSRSKLVAIGLSAAAGGVFLAIVALRPESFSQIVLVRLLGPVGLLLAAGLCFFGALAVGSTLRSNVAAVIEHDGLFLRTLYGRRRVAWSALLNAGLVVRNYGGSDAHFVRVVDTKRRKTDISVAALTTTRDEVEAWLRKVADAHHAALNGGRIAPPTQQAPPRPARSFGRRAS